MGTLNIRCRNILGIQKGTDHNFDNHSYALSPQFQHQSALFGPKQTETPKPETTEELSSLPVKCSIIKPRKPATYKQNTSTTHAQDQVLFLTQWKIHLLGRELSHGQCGKLISGRPRKKIWLWAYLVMTVDSQQRLRIIIGHTVKHPRPHQGTSHVHWASELLYFARMKTCVVYRSSLTILHGTSVAPRKPSRSPKPQARCPNIAAYSHHQEPGDFGFRVFSARASRV